LQRADLADLAVNDVAHSLAVVKSVLDNQPGPASALVASIFFKISGVSVILGFYIYLYAYIVGHGFSWPES
jgi:hypothetical protein